MTINPSFSYHLYHLWKKLPLGVKIPLLITCLNAVNKIPLMNDDFIFIVVAKVAVKII